MTGTSEEALLLAIETRDELFNTLGEILGSDNYLKVLMEIEEGKTQTDVANALGIGNSTVSRAVKELEKNNLIVETDDGHQKILPVLSHPIIQYYFETEVTGDEQ